MSGKDLMELRSNLDFALDRLGFLWAYVFKSCPQCGVYPIDVRTYAADCGFTIEVKCRNCGYRSSETFPVRIDELVRGVRPREAADSP